MRLATMLCAACLVAGANGQGPVDPWQGLRERLRQLAPDGVPAAVLRVGDQPLPPELVQRLAVWAFAPELVAAQTLHLLVGHGARPGNRIGAGAAAAGDDAVDAQLARWRARFPAASIAALHARLQQRTADQRRFDALHLPAAGGTWPASGRAALQAHLGATEATAMIDRAAASSPFFRPLLRGWVRTGLEQMRGVEAIGSDLPPRSCLQVGDATWSTADAFAAARPLLAREDVAAAALWAVVELALERELRRRGAWPSDAEFRAGYDALGPATTVWPGGAPPWVPVAERTAGEDPDVLPERPLLRRSWRLWIGYTRLPAAAGDDAGVAPVRVELLQALARDAVTGAWRPDGHDAARRRATALATALRRGADPAALRAASAEFYAGDRQRGVFPAPVDVAALQHYLGENPVTELGIGPSAARFIVESAAIGDWVGPLRTPRGYVVARVTARSEQPAAARRHAAWRRGFARWAGQVLAAVELSR